MAPSRKGRRRGQDLRVPGVLLGSRSPNHLGLGGRDPAAPGSARFGQAEGARAKAGRAARSYTQRPRREAAPRQGGRVVFERPPHPPPGTRSFPRAPISVEAPTPSPSRQRALLAPWDRVGSEHFQKVPGLTSWESPNILEWVFLFPRLLVPSPFSVTVRSLPLGQGGQDLCSHHSRISLLSDGGRGQDPEAGVDVSSGFPIPS